MRFPFDKFVLGTAYGEKGTAWRCGWHSGLDLKSLHYAGDGKVYPIYGGVVERITSGGSYGNCVYLRHQDNFISLYAHLKAVLVRQGQYLGESKCLGLEGSSGNATGVHLHLEIHQGAYHYPAAIDPLLFIQNRLEGALEVEKKIKIQLNEVEKEVKVIEKDGHNFVLLQDLRDSKIMVDYDSNKAMPIIKCL